MTGTSRAHDTIVTNLAAAIRPALRGTPCRIVSADTRVVIAKVECGCYPGFVVRCDDPADEIDAYGETRPRLVVEVLSPTTETLDRSDECDHCLSIETLEEYVLVAQRELRVEVRARDGVRSRRRSRCGGGRAT